MLRLIFVLLIVTASTTDAAGNTQKQSFDKAKTLMYNIQSDLDDKLPTTVYCSCEYGTSINVVASSRLSRPLFVAHHNICATHQ
jgi:hypothetical protein